MHCCLGMHFSAIQRFCNSCVVFCLYFNLLVCALIVQRVPVVAERTVGHIDVSNLENPQTCLEIHNIIIYLKIKD